MTARKSFSLTPDARKLLEVAASFSKEPVYLVGGALRNALLGLPVHDLDLACAKPEILAKNLAKHLRASLVILDEGNRIYRIALHSSKNIVRQIDVCALWGKSIDDDIRRRDFTINAMAWPLSTKISRTIPVSEIIDPRGGIKDLKTGLIRCESQKLFEEDPLRILRAFRFASQLGFTIDKSTLKLISEIKKLVQKPAAERIQTELLTLLSYSGCSNVVALMDESGVLTALFPGLEPSRTCAISYYGKEGVLGHSLETVRRADFLLFHLDKAFPDFGSTIENKTSAPGAGGFSKKPLLILTALLHDIAKPETAQKIAGRLRFFGHDAIGAKKASEILSALKFPRESIQTTSKVITHHLRPGNLAANPTFTDKAAYRLFRDIGNEALDLLLVCWADHASYIPQKRLLELLKLAGSIPNTPETKKIKPVEYRKTIHHLQVVAALLRRLTDKKNQPVPKPFLNGNEIMSQLSIPPGPKIGKILDRLREAQAVSKVKDKKEALAWIKKLRAR